MMLSRTLFATLTSLAAGAASTAAGAAASAAESPTPPHIDSHASGAANTEALQKARADKDAFVGKELFFSNGKDVGKIRDIRRWNRDNELYMIVAAKPFFNEDVDYAVPVGDVSRVLPDRVELPESPGMHLRGMQYYPEDFKDMDAGEMIPLIVDE